MKKILTVFLSLCLLASLATCFAFSASAEETDIEVTVGQVFEWNDQSKDSKTQMAWRRSEGKSPDGLWKYQFYATSKKVYTDMVLTTAGEFAWNKTPGADDYGVGHCRVRSFGKNFHPGYAADAVKVFTCPSGGSIQISTTIARTAAVGSSGNGTSFAIYVEDRLVYPEEGSDEYLTLTSTDPQTIDVTVDVAKNERVRIHIGAIGDQASDSVDMSNTITYKSVNDEVGEQVSGSTLPGNYVNSTKTQNKDNDNNNDNSDRVLPDGNDGLSAGAIVGIVVAVVAVVGIAVAVVVILKKKKQE